MRAIELFDASTTLPTVNAHVKGASVDFQYFPAGTWPEFFLCAEVQALALHSATGFAAFIFCPDRSHCATKPWLQVYDVKGTQSCVGAASLSEKVLAVALSKDNVVVVAHMGHVDFYTSPPPQPGCFGSPQYKKSATLALGQTETVSVLRFSDAGFVVAGTKEGKLYAWNVELAGATGALHVRELRAWDLAEVHRPVVDVQCFGRVVVASAWGHTLAAWNLDNVPTEGPDLVFESHRNARSKLCFDIDDKLGLLAAGGDDGAVRFWDLARGGTPLAVVPFGNGVPVDVKLVSKDGEASGVWVKTRNRLYVAAART